MRVLLASLVVVGMFAPAGIAGETPVGKVVLDLWDAAYLQGGRAGHVHTFVEEFERDGEKLLRTTVELRLKVKRFSDTVELGMDSGRLLDFRWKGHWRFHAANAGQGQETRNRRHRQGRARSLHPRRNQTAPLSTPGTRTPSGSSPADHTKGTQGKARRQVQLSVL